MIEAAATTVAPACSATATVSSVLLPVVTTGKSTLETVAVAERAGAKVVAAASIINRGGGDEMNVPYVSLAEARFPTYAADALPDHLRGVPVIKPGSRPGQK